jgi:hypothetical protein
MLLIIDIPLDKGLWTKASQGRIRKFKGTESIQKKNKMLTFLQITIKGTGLQKHIQSITGNIWNTLDMAPGAKSTLQTRGIAEYLKNY